MLELALAHHRSGQIGQAETLYRSIINMAPGHADALHLLGLIEYQRGNLSVSERFIRRAIARDSSAPFFYVNLGNALNGQGKTDDAIAAFERAVTMDPNVAEAHYNLANGLYEKGSFDPAILHYKAAISLNPAIAEAHYNLGKVLQETGRTDEAVESYQNAIKKRLGYAEAYFNLGIMFQDLGRIREAEECYKQAVSAKPDYAEAFYNLGDILSVQERYEEAEYCLRKALLAKPDYAESYNNLGNVLRNMGRRAEAFESYRLALSIKPDYADAHNNLAVAFRERGMTEEAIASCQRAIELEPEFAEAHWNMSLALLTQGRLREGWEKYEWRFLKKNANSRHFPCPAWSGSPLEGRTVLVHAEQGIGDEIMFASCLPDVIAMGGRCKVECDERLMHLFSRSFPGARFIAKKGSISQHPTLSTVGISNPSLNVGAAVDADFHIPAGSLPRFFRNDISSFPKRKAYLIPDEGRLLAWKERMAAFGGLVKIGISWRAGKDPAARYMRSTDLEQWKELFLIPGTCFINLQYGHCADEIREAGEKTGVVIHDWDDADPLQDLDSFAAQVASLDLVISVDNSTVHMAGALGVPVWTLLPYGCDWRWMRDVPDTPWYLTMKLLRQDGTGDWAEVFCRAAKMLKYLCSE